MGLSGHVCPYRLSKVYYAWQAAAQFSSLFQNKNHEKSHKRSLAYDVRCTVLVVIMWNQHNNLPAEWLNFKLFGGMEFLLNMNRSKKSELFF